MDLTEKIKHILEIKNFTPSHFADEIGIQRASISHILAGRNKPSLDIIQKIIRRFPDLGFDWIMDEYDLPEINQQKTISETANPTSGTAGRNKKQLSTDQYIHNDTIEKEAANVVLEAIEPKEKKIDRILILYTDGSFQEFKN